MAIPYELILCGSDPVSTPGEWDELHRLLSEQRPAWTVTRCHDFSGTAVPSVSKVHIRCEKERLTVDGPQRLIVLLPLRLSDLLLRLDHMQQMVSSGPGTELAHCRRWLNQQGAPGFTDQEEILLRVLLRMPDHCARRKELIDLLWPGLLEKISPENLAHRLRVLLGRVRKKLKGGPFSLVGHTGTTTERICLERASHEIQS